MASAHALAGNLLSRFAAHELDALRNDPETAISAVVPEVTVEFVDFVTTGTCDVEGLYHQATRHITVQRAMSYRRTKFTTLHELGHDQARHDPTVARAIAGQAHKQGHTFEETIADAFAAAVLIPDEVVADILDNRLPTADRVIELFHDPRVHGSRAACCYRVAQTMPGTGYVLVAQDDHILACASVGSAFKISRGAKQDDDHIIAVASRTGRAISDIVRVRHRSGQLSPHTYAGQAVQDTDGYVFAILTDSTNPPWGPWRPPTKPQWEAPEIYCADCDAVSEFWQRCETNSSHRVCGACGWCECRQARSKVAERACTVCFTRKRVDLFEPGATTCKDCA